MLIDTVNLRPHTHPASQVNVEGTYPHIPGTPADLETTIGLIDNAFATCCFNEDVILTTVDANVVINRYGNVVRRI